MGEILFRFHHAVAFTMMGARGETDRKQAANPAWQDSAPQLCVHLIGAPYCVTASGRRATRDISCRSVHTAVQSLAAEGAEAHLGLVGHGGGTQLQHAAPVEQRPRV